MTQRKKVYYKDVKVVKPFCPKCDRQVEVPICKHFRTIATYRCSWCGYIE